MLKNIKYILFICKLVLNFTSICRGLRGTERRTESAVWMPCVESRVCVARYVEIPIDYYYYVVAACYTIFVYTFEHRDY